MFKVLKKSQDHTIGDSNKRSKSSNSHATSNTPIQPGGTKLRDPEAIWASKCSWQVSPPSDCYRDIIHGDISKVRVTMVKIYLKSMMSTHTEFLPKNI